MPQRGWVGVRLSATRVALMGVALAGILLVASRADATSITLNFSGTVDLSVFGASSTSTYEGSVTWDPATATTFSTGVNFADYSFESASLSINSTDFSSAIAGPSVSESRLLVVNDPDTFELILYFSPFLDVGPSATDIEIFNLLLTDSTNAMFSDLSLPSEGDFLASVDDKFSLFHILQPSVVGSTDVDPSVTIAPVPEPTSLLLLGTGLLGAGVRRRKRKK